MKNGDVVEEGTKLFDVEICTHPGLYGGICISCGEVPRDTSPSSSSSSSSFGGDSRQCDYRALTVGGGHTIRLSKAESESVSAIRTSTLKSQRKIGFLQIQPIQF